MRRTICLMGLLAGAALLVMPGCGSEGPTIDTGARLKDLKITPTAGATGSVNPADTAKEIQTLRDQVSRNYQRNTNLRADVTLYVKNLQKGNIESAKIDYWFQKPAATALVIKEHSKPAANGTKMVWMGGDKIGVKTKFIGFWVKTSLPMTDDRLLDARGDKLSDTSVPKMMATILDPKAQVSFVGRGEYKGNPVVQIAIKSSSMLSRVTSERIAIDTKTFLPVVREMYEGNALTYRLQLEGIKLNIHEPAAFTLD